MSVRRPLPVEYTMPAWMKAERIDYCEHFDREAAFAQKETIWTKILHLFA